MNSLKYTPNDIYRVAKTFIDTQTDIYEHVKRGLPALYEFFRLITEALHDALQETEEQKKDIRELQSLLLQIATLGIDIPLDEIDTALQITKSNKSVYSVVKCNRIGPVGIVLTGATFDEAVNRCESLRNHDQEHYYKVIYESTP